MRTILVMSVFALCAAAPQDKPKRKLAWLLPKTHVAEYSVLGSNGKPIADRAFWVFGSELTETGANRIAVDRYTHIPYALLFHLPSHEVKPGEQWEHQEYFFYEAQYGSDGMGGFGFGWGWGGGATSIRPVVAKGRYVFRKIEKDKKTDAELAVIDGEFTLLELRQERSNNDNKMVITKNDVGTISVSMLLHVTRGVLQRGTYSVKTRAQERLPVKDDTKVLEKRLTFVETLELKEELEFGGEKLGKAVEAQVKKAADWLRKQQAAGGDWAAFRTIEENNAKASTTGLCVRALLAAGAKPDDPAVDKAIRWLRTQTAGTPQAVDWQMTAFVYRAAPSDKPYAECDLATARADVRKSLPKQDADWIKALTANLVSRRETASGIWPAIDKESPNVLTTRAAIEALALASEAGIDTPLELWNHAMQTVLDACADMGLELELAFEGIEYPDKDVDAKKKVRPQSCRFNPGDTQSRNREGNALCTYSAASILRYAQIELTRRGVLKDSQKRLLDGAQRGLLAWLQSRRTWRTVPPTEAEWCVNRYQHAHAMGELLTLYGAKKVEGVDWHSEGAYHLMREQCGDGRWDTEYGSPLSETAHCILFLTRGTLRPSPVK